MFYVPAQDGESLCSERSLRDGLCQQPTGLERDIPRFERDLRVYYLEIVPWRAPPPRADNILTSLGCRFLPDSLEFRL